MGTSVLATLIPEQRNELELTCDAACVGAARRWAIGHPATRILRVDLDVLVGVVSELVTNALVHACMPPLTLSLFAREGSLYVVVMDGCPEKVPEPRVAGREEDGGRGLLLVAAETQEWGWQVNRGENVKLVWARI